MSKPNVLIVEDSVRYQREFEELLADYFNIIAAYSIAQARDFFDANPGMEISAIAMDACVPGDDINTIPLVRHFRKTFLGPMIAISSLQEYSDKLMQAGCDYECPKWDLPKVLLKILNPS